DRVHGGPERGPGVRLLLRRLRELPLPLPVRQDRRGAVERIGSLQLLRGRSGDPVRRSRHRQRHPAGPADAASGAAELRYRGQERRRLRCGHDHDLGGAPGRRDGSIMRRRIVTVLALALLVLPAIAFGQGGPFAAQIQAALRSFLRVPHAWSATQTFSSIVVSSCTGCGGATPPGSNTQLVFNDGGAFGAVADLTFTKGTNIPDLGSGG